MSPHHVTRCGHCRVSILEAELDEWGMCSDCRELFGADRDERDREHP